MARGFFVLFCKNSTIILHRPLAHKPRLLWTGRPRPPNLLKGHSAGPARGVTSQCALTGTDLSLTTSGQECAVLWDSAEGNFLDLRLCHALVPPVESL